MRIEAFEQPGLVRRLRMEFGLALAGFAVVLLAGLGLAGAGAAESPIEEEQWTKCGSADPEVQCSFARGVAASPVDGHVYVADQNNLRVVEFDAVGKFIRTWGSEGGGPGQFAGSGPQGAAVDSAGNVWVVDFSNRRVQKFDPEGNFLLMLGGEVNKTKSEEPGSGEADRNLCPVDPGDECKAGVQGGGEGQFGEWRIGSFIAIAPSDKVYVGDQNRIQRFDSSGHYQDEIAVPGRTVKGLAADSEGNLYAIYNNQLDVRKLTPAGVELATPRFELKAPGGQKLNPGGVAVSAGGEVFASSSTSAEGAQDKVEPLWRFSPAGEPLANFGGKGQFAGPSTGLATNLCPGSEAPGNLYATNPSSANGFVRAYGTDPVGCVKAVTGPAEQIAETAARLTGTVDPDGSPVAGCAFDYGLDDTYGSTAPCAQSGAEIGEGSEPVPVHADLAGLAAGTVYHYRLRATVDGNLEQGFDRTFKTLGPPVITADMTLGATDTEATLGAEVNPEGFPTTYHFEYGLDDSYGQSTPPQSAGSDRNPHAAAATLSGLAPGTTYHWRIVASNSSGPSEGEDHVLTTYRTSAPEAGCANQALRTGASALLPDCRAYEMVSPVDKNGGDIVAGASSRARDPDGYVQASPDGERITYTSRTTFGDQAAGLLYNQYIAARDGGSGWSSEGINAPAGAGPLVAGGANTNFGRHHIAFSRDLCSAWLADFHEPPPTPDGQDGFANLYRRQSCEPGAGTLEALAPAPPALPGGTLAQYVDVTSVQGVSADGRHALFVAAAPLSPGAAANSSTQIYDRFEGGLSVVSVLPSGVADSAPDLLGSGWLQNLDGAVSDNGSRVYWTSGSGGGGGTIYMREHPEQGIVADECDPGNACTVPVGGSAILPAHFWGASPDGARALYSEKVFGEADPDLYEFRLGEPRRLVAHEVAGVAGHSEDLSRIYFVSTEALAAGAQAGEPNLYLDEEGTIDFVATLVAGDVGAKEPDLNAVLAYNLIGEPYLRATRVSADGRRIAFQSRAPLTGVDNTDAASGKPLVQVFTYEAGSGALHCVSCNPSGAAPRGRILPEPYVRPWEHQRPTAVRAAAWLPTWEHALHASNAISADGGRIFFNSNDRLLPRDANATQDVYEWEEAGVGTCSEASASYFAKNGGCLYLISSGAGSFEAEFWEANANGEDVFFTTDSSLVPADPGLVDLYDARVGGGIPAPAAQAGCEGEACQSAPPPPPYSDPGSATYSGPANPRVAQPLRCPKGKRKVRRNGKARCVPRRRRPAVAKHKGKHQRRTGAERRAGR